MVMLFLYSMLMVIGALVAALLLSAATGMPSRTAFTITFLAAFVPMTVIPMLDRRLAGRLNPQGAAARIFGRIARAGLFFSPIRFTAPVQFVFQSRVGERKLSMALGAAATVIVSALLIGLFLRSGELRLDGWTYFDPRPTAPSVDPRHYRNSGVARVGGLYKLSIDDTALTTSFSFTRDADSDFVGVLAYVPTTGLQPGPHEFAIDAPGNGETAPR